MRSKFILIPFILTIFLIVLMSLLPKDLVGTVYADSNYCIAAGFHACTVGNPAGSCTKDGKTCTAYEYYKCNFGGQDYCDTSNCAEPCSGGSSTGGKSSESDGPGGCCTPGAADNSDAGCRRDSKPDGLREVCDISNGACASNKSCRSETGCALDTDCGPGNHCEGGQCKSGPPSGKCQSAKSLQARFQLSSTDSWGTSKQASAGQTVNAAILRNGEGAFAGAPVNGVAITDTITARITGPGVNQSIDVSKPNPFTPSQSGTYNLSAACGSDVQSDQAVLTVTGGSSSSSPSPSTPTTVTLSGKITNSITGNGIANVDINKDYPTCGGLSHQASMVTDASGHFSAANVPAGTPFCLRPPQVPGYILTSPAEGGYEWQIAGQWCGTKGSSCSNPKITCGSSETNLDLCADNSYNFTYTPLSCSISGDFDGNGLIELNDFDVWKKAFVNGNPIINPLHNCDGVAVDLVLFNTWRSKFATQ